MDEPDFLAKTSAQTPPHRLAMNKGRRPRPALPEAAQEPASVAGRRDGSRQGRRASFGPAALVAVLLLGAGGWYLVKSMSDSSKLQDCVASGRKNCSPVDNAGR